MPVFTFSPSRNCSRTSRELSTANPHGEYYLTDMAEVLRKARQRVVVWKTEDSAEVLGANTRAELSLIDSPDAHAQVP